MYLGHSAANIILDGNDRQIACAPLDRLHRLFKGGKASKVGVRRRLTRQRVGVGALYSLIGDVLNILNIFHGYGVGDVMTAGVASAASAVTMASVARAAGGEAGALSQWAHRECARLEGAYRDRFVFIVLTCYHKGKEI